MFYHTINPTLLQIGPFQIRYYGIIFVLGFITGFFLLSYLARERKLPLSKDDILNLLFYLAVGIVAGSRTFYVLFYNAGYYVLNPLSIFAVWKGGLSFHGGLAGAAIAGWYFAKKHKIKFYDLADIVMVPVALGLFLGRIGNFINGELYGRVWNGFLCVDYSQNSHIGFFPKMCRYPSQLAESMKNLIIFTVLWGMKDRKLPRGFMFWTFVFLYGFIRFFIEFIREPDEQLGFIMLSLTAGQLFSILMVITSGAFLFKIMGGRNGMQKRREPEQM